MLPEPNISTQRHNLWVATRISLRLQAEKIPATLVGDLYLQAIAVSAVCEGLCLLQADSSSGACTDRKSTLKIVTVSPCQQPYV